MEPLGVLLALSVVVEVLLEMLKPLLDPLIEAFRTAVGLTGPSKAYMYISVALGILFAYAFEANLLSVVGLPTGTVLQLNLGLIFTGLAFGGGSNMVHQILEKLGGR